MAGPLPALRGRERTGQDASDLPHGARGHRAAEVRPAPGPGAVVRAAGILAALGVPVLNQRPAVAQGTAGAQPGVERVQHRPADLAQRHAAEGGLEGAADVAGIAELGAGLDLDHRHVLVQQDAERRVGLGRPAN